MANISAWSSTAADNDAATPDGFPEGQSPGSLNDCGRELMAAVRRWYEDAQWINFGHTPTKVDSDTFTVSGDQTSIYDAGRRIKFTGSVSGYATIASSSYSAPNTTVNVTAASWTGTLTAVAVGVISGTNSALPATQAGSTVWTSGNDGAGSGLDADLLDGLNSTSFLRTTDIVRAVKTADESSSSSSAQSDDHLSVSLAANTRYALATVRAGSWIKFTRMS